MQVIIPDQLECSTVHIGPIKLVELALIHVQEQEKGQMNKGIGHGLNLHVQYDQRLLCKENTQNGNITGNKMFQNEHFLFLTLTF